MKLWFSKKQDATVETPSPAPVSPPPAHAAAAPAAAPVQQAPASPLTPVPPPVPAAQVPPPAAVPPAPAQPHQKPASQRELYLNLMDALYDAVLLADEKGHVIDSNARVEQTFGYSKNEMWDMSLQRLIKGFGEHIMRQLAEPLSQGRPVIIEGRGVRKDNTIFNAEISVGLVKLGRIERILFSIRDISKRILAVQQKVRAQIAAEKESGQSGASKVLRLVRPPIPRPPAAK